MSDPLGGRRAPAAGWNPLLPSTDPTEERRMDELDAAEQWLRGYLAGRDGRAPEKYLLEAGAEHGHTAATLHSVKEYLGVVTGELAPRTKWSRWWWLPSAGYSEGDAKAAGITGYNHWPYGPNIDLTSRVRLVNWAKKHGLKVARHDAPLCLKWLENGRCRGCDVKGPGHDEFRLDHMSGWTRNGRPAVIINHPYFVTDRDFELLATAVRDHPGLRVSMPGFGWYGHATVQVEVWNKDVEDEAERERRARRG
ncbi:hypothetical protein [Nonomuraea angiospora]